jgi:hypothetical protein
MRFQVDARGCGRVIGEGLLPAEIHEALAGPGPRLLDPIADDTLAVIVRTATGRLIEVWLVEDPDDGAREIYIAFDAGFLAAAKWKNAFGQEEQQR